MLNITKQYLCMYFMGGNVIVETINYYIFAFTMYEIDNNIML